MGRKRKKNRALDKQSNRNGRMDKDSKKGELTVEKLTKYLKEIFFNRISMRDVRIMTTDEDQANAYAKLLGYNDWKDYGGVTEDIKWADYEKDK